MLKRKSAPVQPLRRGVAKVPTVIQMEALECGAACLTMILHYYKKYLPLEQVRADCGVSRDGSSAKNMLRAARHYGLTAKGYRYEPEDLRRSGSFPCIIHWNFNHFVVLCGFRGEHVYLNDPAKGNVKISMEDFDKSFTGICLMFAPGEDFKPEGRPQSVLPFARRKLRGTGSAFALVVTATVISSLIGLITPGFSNVFADRLLSGRNPEWFLPFIYGLSALSVVQIIVEFIQANFVMKVDGKIAVVATSEYMWHILRLPMEFYSQRMVGDVISRKAQNADIARSLIATFAPLCIEGFMMIFYLVVLLRYSIPLTFLGLLSVLINTVVAHYISKKHIDLARIADRDESQLEGSTMSGISMIESIKAAGAEEGFFEKWSGFQAEVNKGEVLYTSTDALISLFPSILSSFLDMAILAGSIYLCMRGEWTVGMVSAFSGFLSSFVSPALQFSEAGQTLQEMRTAMERVEDVMEYPTDVEYMPADLSDGVSYDKLSGKIELRHVTFGYSRLAEPLIEDFSMTVEPGQKIAFVGASGCGKSTLSKLISGLYKPWSGEILFDGKPISEIDRNVFSSSLSVVDQDIILFEDTIANNIKMWDESIEDFEMILAARDAQLHEDIMQRDGGYHGVLTEGGKDLSGGQRQRLEIARVLAVDPRIIIMDEATSALDAQTEYNVVKSITDRGITCIVVAHRLSTIRDCDEIVVLDRGRVVERGTHAELYARGGLYTKLVSSE